MGVIVLSEDYVQSLWPMLELQHLLSDSDRLIFPLFYQLQPAELSDSSNLARWIECWAKKAPRWQSKMLRLQEVMSLNGWELQINLDISSWADNLGKLQCRSGLVRTRYQSDYAYIQAVVSDICVQLPPPRMSSLGVAIKGVERMQKVIAGALEQEGSMGDDGVQAVGVHGIGGSGKTTLCEAMANYYSNGFLGRSFFLEFPSEENKIDPILHKIDPILKSLSCPAPSASSLNQALSLLEGGLQRNKVFLAIDNVWDHNLEYALRIMLMKCMPGSKILVTSRSKTIVTQLLRSREDHIGNATVRHPGVSLPYCKTVSVLEIPSLTELEAMEVLKSYSCHSRFIPEDCLRSLARSCFFGEQCHPLCLKLRGNELRRRGRASFDDQRWQSLILGLQDAVGVNIGAPNAVDTIEQAVLQIVGKSLDGLPSQLQDIFAHIATCQVLAERREVEEIIMLLRLLRYYDDFTEDDMRYQVINVLEYHGLVEIVEDQWLGEAEETYERLVIHDLHKQVAKSRVSSAAAACGLCAGPHDIKYTLCWEAGEDLSDVSTQKLMSRKHVWGHNVPESTWKAMFPRRSILSDYLSRVFVVRPPARQAQTRYLHLRGFWARSLQLGVGNIMTGLRALRLDGDDAKLKKIQGWEGVPNLVRLELNVLSGLEEIGPIACLKKLERLSLQHCNSLKLETIVGGDDRKSLVRVGDHFPKLQHFQFSNNGENLVEVGPAVSDVFPALKELNLRRCENLKSFPELKSLGMSLRVLDLSGCLELRRMEGSICSLTALQHLRLDGCTNLESMPDMSNVASLRSLAIGGRCWWRFFMTTNSSVNNLLGHSNTANYSNNYGLTSTDHADGHDLQSPRELSDALNVIPLIHLHTLLFNAADSGASAPVVRFLNLSGLPSLRRVKLRSFGSVQKLSFSSSQANLESVSIRDFPCLEEVCGFGAHHTHLRSVSIENCPLLVIRTPGLECLPLRNLKITKCHEGFMCRNSPIAVSLQRLEVEDCSSWTDVSSLAALDKCLVSLKLKRCTSMRDISGLAADLNTTTLTQLQLYDCRSLFDVSSLAALTSLTNLELHGCSALTDVSSLAGLTSLTNLVLDGCSGLTDVSSLAGLTSLTDLRLGDCKALTDVSSLAGLRSLKMLDLHWCSALTDLSDLVGLTSLRWLRMMNCCSVREFPDLKHLKGLERVTFWLFDAKEGDTLKEGDVRQLVSAKTDVDYYLLRDY